MSIGFIGLGSIGTPMAKQIAGTDFSMVVHDVREEAADRDSSVFLTLQEERSGAQVRVK